MENSANPYYQPNQKESVVVPDSVWKNILSPEVYYVARQKGTERPFTSPFEESKEVGTYHCAACGNRRPRAPRPRTPLASSAADT